jgi:phosphoglycerate dehydrogenase-like enzyme
MPPPLTIWCNAKLPPADWDHLRRSAEPHRVIAATAATPSNLHPGQRDPALATADVALGQPDPQQVIESPGVRWVHLTSAGYTRYDTDPFRNAIKARGGALTNSSSVYNAPCAEHALAMIMCLARGLPAALDDQRGPRRWPGDAIRTSAYLLDGQSILIYGYGAIGRRLAQLLLPLRMKVTGVRRRTDGAEPVPLVTPDAADALLPTADHVMDILPLSDHTARFFDARRLALLPPTARFYNIGRGGTVDQAALTAALQANRIAGAYLDVTDPEPLPPTDPLWSLPNCWITPHAAGGHATEFRRLADHFLGNLQRYAAGEALVDRVV